MENLLPQFVWWSTNYNDGYDKITYNYSNDNNNNDNYNNINNNNNNTNGNDGKIININCLPERWTQEHGRVPVPVAGDA